MKTAMQELIDKVEHAISYNVEGGLVEKYTWEELFNDMYLLLKKEKEHIIELPSDEEIDEESPYIPNDSKIDYLSHQEGFIKGAKWMKEQIINQNK